MSGGNYKTTTTTPTWSSSNQHAVDDDQPQCCGECVSCMHLLHLQLADNNNERSVATAPLSKRFVTMGAGSVRYGVRLGAVSPPPPGAGYARYYRCWPTTTTPTTTPPPPPPSPPINSGDIFGCGGGVAVRSQLLLGTLLKKQHQQQQQHAVDATSVTFRFGGNRGTLMERRKQQQQQQKPVPPPRTRHHHHHHHHSHQQQQRNEEQQHQPAARPLLPMRSASFSEVDFSTVDNKYVMKTEKAECDSSGGGGGIDGADAMATLPRAKVRRDPPPTDAISAEYVEKKRDKSRRRKGIYLDQWPTMAAEAAAAATADEVAEVDHPSVKVNTWSVNTYADIPRVHISTVSSAGDGVEESPAAAPPPQSLLLTRTDSLSEGERSETASDCELPERRYSKRPLRGPYGAMLEAEMKKPEAGRKMQQHHHELKFLEDLSAGSTVSLLSSSGSIRQQQQQQQQHPRGASNHSLDDSQLSPAPTPTTPTKQQQQQQQQKLTVSHQRTTSSPSKLESSCTSPPEEQASSELLERLLRGSSEQLALNDTRTHVVIELYDTERYYVESLQILITKYLEPLKSPENAGLLDATLVDEIFYQIPTLFSHHNVFLEDLKKRLDHWDVKQKVGDVLHNMYSNPIVIESYTNYVNNCKRAREIYKSAQQSKPAFARFLGATAREHKGKLPLDALLIKPIQIFPKYELLLQRLIKHTQSAHPDHGLLLAAQRELHEQIVKINCTEREALGLDQLREIESLVEGLIELVASDRQYLRHDLVQMKAAGGALKERALFLFSDLLLVTSIKRRSGATRRPMTTTTAGGGALDGGNKYKLLMRCALDDLEIARARDDSVRATMLEIEKLTEDVATLNQIQELVWSLHRGGHGQLDDIVREMLASASKQLGEQQASDAGLCCLDLTVATSAEMVSLVFAKPEKRAAWEESFNEAKHKLAMSGERRPCPELLATVPIRKTRAGLQFTCAAPTHGDGDVWVCNSDGYVGQVCVLSLQPEPTVTSCNGVCNARILCIASVPPPAASGLCMYSPEPPEAEVKESPQQQPIEFDSSSSSEYDERSDAEENDVQQQHQQQQQQQAPPLSGEQEDDEELRIVSLLVDSDEAADAGHSITSTTTSSTMWLGTEDGCVHVYNAADNIRIKKNKIKIQHSAAILCIIYLENRVFISLANGDLVVYERDAAGAWNTSTPTSLTVGSAQQPVTRMLPNGGKLWCACGNSIRVLDTVALTIEHTFAVHQDAHKPIACLVVAGNGVWLSLQNAAMVKCYHAATFDLLAEVNVAPAVTKMLTSCDDIIRQHKAACLRVTSLLACKELLWIGTSAGVLLTMPLPHIAATATTRLSNVPSVMGVPHGHTGHVRFLSHMEWPGGANNTSKALVISGGDGYEDFRNATLSEVAGREDSTNHLLLWNI